MTRVKPYKHYCYIGISLCFLVLHACSLRPLYEDKNKQNYDLSNIYVEMPEGRLGQLVYNAVYPNTQSQRDKALYILHINIQDVLEKHVLTNSLDVDQRVIVVKKIIWHLTKTGDENNVYLRSFFTVEKLYLASDNHITKTVVKTNDLRALAREISRLLVNDIEGNLLIRSTKSDEIKHKNH